MARPVYIKYPGALHRVVARGNQGRPVFRHRQNRKTSPTGRGQACAIGGFGRCMPL